MKTKLLFLIIVLASFLRIWRLDINPPHLTSDEASLGYNAYSILKTGRDEYGEILPLIFKSFGDYKPGFYVYLTVPFVALFGLNEWSVRLPGAISGILAVYLIYLLVNELSIYVLKESNSGKNKTSIDETFLLGLLAALLLAINPWHINFSRGAWEINVSLTLTLAGILFFLKSFRFPKHIILSSLLFSLTFITYQGAKLSTFIVLIVLFLTFLKESVNIVKKNTKLIVISVLLSLIISSSIFLSFSKGQTGRLKVFSVFSYPRPTEYLQMFLNKAGEKKNDINYILYHSENLNFIRGILGRYANHFSGRFLFFDGDYQNPKHSSPNHGMLMLFDIILLPLGLIGIVRQNTSIKKFVLLWLFLSPLPAVLTRDQVQAVRAYNMVIPLILISSFGLVNLITYLKKLVANKRQKTFVSLTSFSVLIFIGSLIYFYDSFFIHLPIHNAKYWNYGYKQVVKEMLPIQDKYTKIYFQQSYDQPYIYYLFYSKYDPSSYQKQAKLSYYLGPDVGLVESIDNIKFTSWSWPYATGEKYTLIIGNSVAIPSDFNQKEYNLIADIKYPDKYMPAFRMLETK